MIRRKLILIVLTMFHLLLGNLYHWFKCTIQSFDVDDDFKIIFEI